MKQTNNAIKFLMAQYRAIFKNAYFKGMASAVLLTAGLAVLKLLITMRPHSLLSVVKA